MTSTGRGHEFMIRIPISPRSSVTSFYGKRQQQRCRPQLTVKHMPTQHTGNHARLLRPVMAVASEDDIVRVAAVGDLVAVHFVCKGEDGQVLESSYEVNEPLSFEIGAGDMMGNKLFQGFDEAVRGLAVGQRTELEASGGEWNRDLLFSVPVDHPEIARLQGRYKNQGGLARGLIIELSNNSMALVIDINDKEVKIDANNMLAGKKLFFELEILAIETAPPK